MKGYNMFTECYDDKTKARLKEQINNGGIYIIFETELEEEFEYFLNEAANVGYVLVQASSEFKWRAVMKRDKTLAEEWENI